ncbi:hypothetical protein C4D60_Mb11t19640 [Musa balbisiana]|uniref:Uncharacterized protein n=1 Tax=Musa balbisiana TaxID=52838 RepID=A0A4S8J5B2_MUSBA|nr:hypothetical protein C4D60_Mb11t19640 [Musa balbisiana]
MRNEDEGKTFSVLPCMVLVNTYRNANKRDRNQCHNGYGLVSQQKKSIDSSLGLLDETKSTLTLKKMDSIVDARVDDRSYKKRPRKSPRKHHPETPKDCDVEKHDNTVYID